MTKAVFTFELVVVLQKRDVSELNESSRSLQAIALLIITLQDFLSIADPWFVPL